MIKCRIVNDSWGCQKLPREHNWWRNSFRTWGKAALCYLWCSQVPKGKVVIGGDYLGNNTSAFPGICSLHSVSHSFIEDMTAGREAWFTATIAPVFTSRWPVEVIRSKSFCHIRPSHLTQPSITVGFQITTRNEILCIITISIFLGKPWSYKCAKPQASYFY